MSVIYACAEVRNRYYSRLDFILKVIYLWPARQLFDQFRNNKKKDCTSLPNQGIFDRESESTALYPRRIGLPGPPDLNVTIFEQTDLIFVSHGLTSLHTNGTMAVGQDKGLSIRASIPHTNKALVPQ